IAGDSDRLAARLVDDCREQAAGIPRDAGDPGLLFRERREWAVRIVGEIASVALGVRSEEVGGMPLGIQGLDNREAAFDRGQGRGRGGLPVGGGAGALPAGIFAW